MGRSQENRLRKYSANCCGVRTPRLGAARSQRRRRYARDGAAHKAISKFQAVARRAKADMREMEERLLRQKGVIKDSPATPSDSGAVVACAALWR